MLLLVADVIEVFGKVLNKVCIFVYKPFSATFLTNFNGFKCTEVVSLFIYLSLPNRVYWVGVTFKIVLNNASTNLDKKVKKCYNVCKQRNVSIFCGFKEL